jgi:hypothetical protein
MNENISLDRTLLLEVVQQQIIYENFIDTLEKFAGDTKDKVITVINDFKDFAAVIYRVMKQDLTDKFSNSLLRTFQYSEINKKIQAMLDKIGKSDLLKDTISKIKTIQNPILKLLSAVGITVTAKYFYDKFKNLDLIKDAGMQAINFATEFLSNQALDTIKGFLTGGISELVKWLQRIGVAASNVYKTLQTSIDAYKDAFSKEDSGDKWATKLVKEQIEEISEGEFCPQCLAEYIEDHVSQPLEEAKYKGRTVPLGKPMAGDVKKFKVYVKNKKGNVIKVNFGQKGVKIKKSNPERRKSFRARHKCDTAKDRTTPRYWSCRKW